MNDEVYIDVQTDDKINEEINQEIMGMKTLHLNDKDIPKKF